MNDKKIIEDVTQQSFIRSASAQFLAAMLKNGVEEDLVGRATNLAFALNEELVKRFTQK